MMELFVATVLTLIAVSNCARDADLVDFLPGLDPQPGFRHYAGYLNATGEKRFFYWFVESELIPPAEAPLVLWLNGGPGCSSMTGKLVELGPWRVKSDGSGLDWFQHRWNKIANIIFMESPQCVGFSYSGDQNCTSGDDQTALDNHEALKDFLAGFPEYATNDFYVTGESYAGIYVPTLSARLVDDPIFNFKGFAVGNAVTDYAMMDNAMVEFLWARGLFGTELFNNLVNTCCPGSNATNCDYVGNPSMECRALMQQVDNIAWNSGLNPYQLYDECYGGAPGPLGIYEETEGWARMVLPDSIPLMTKESREKYRTFFKEMSMKKTVKASIPCTDTSARDIYLNNPEVRAALHVPTFVPPWEACSSNVSSVYDRQYTTVINEYLKVLAAGHRILVFNGDLDMACNHLGDMWFVESVGQQELVGYRDWFYTGSSDEFQIAGYVLQHERLTFATVKGAGHFVPTDKPWPAYIMWEKFINNEPYP